MVERPSGPPVSTMAGILLLGGMRRKSGDRCSPLHKIHCMHLVGQPDLLEHDGGLLSVGSLVGP
jgi:hypothetical protein